MKLKIILLILLQPILVFGRNNELDYELFVPNIDIPINEVYCLVQDQHGFIWCSSSRGITRYDGTNSVTLGIEDGLNDPTVFKLIEYDDRIWFSCYNGDIGYVENLKAHIVRTIPNEEFVIKNLFVFGDYLYYQLFGEISVGYDQIDKNGNLVEHFTQKEPGIKIDEISGKPFIYGYTNFPASTIVRNQDTVKVHTNASYLSELNAFDHSSSTYVYGQQSILKIKDSSYTSITTESKICPSHYIDSYNNVWFPTEKGIVVLNKGNLHDTTILFSEYRVSDILEDHEKNIWISTLENGIFILNRYRLKQLTAKKINLINSIDDSLYLVKKHQVLVFDQHHKYSRNYHIPSEASFIGKIHGKKTILNKWGNDLPKDTLISGFNVSRHHSGYTIIDTPERFVNISFKYVFVYTPDSIQVIKCCKGLLNTIRCATQLNDSIGYFSNISGLYRLDLSKDNTAHISKISDTPYRTLFVKGNKIYGTIKGVGLVRYHLDWAPIDTINTKTGLSSNFINHILWINDTLVLGTSQGVNILYKVQPTEPYQILHLKKTNGLPDNETTALYYKNQTLYISTLKGTYSIPVDEIFKQNLTRWILGIETINDSTVLNQNQCKLPAGTQFIHVQFHAISFSNSEKPIVKYRFKNLDTTWRTTQNNTIELGNVKPGNYQLELQLGEIQTSFIIQVEAAFHETFLFWFSVVFSILLIISYIIFKSISSRELRLKQNLDKIQLQQIVLTTRLNPHFIFNSLSSLQTLILQQKTKESIRFLSHFSALMRQLLDRSGENYTLIFQEIDFIDQYVNIENQRFGMHTQIEWFIDQRIDKNNFKIPSMLLQPLVENSIQHGFRNYQMNGKIRIEILALSKTTLSISISDNGKGITKQKQETSTSKSTSLIKERIALMGNVYSEQYSFTIENITNPSGALCGTLTKMLLPYEQKQ